MIPLIVTAEYHQALVSGIGVMRDQIPGTGRARGVFQRLMILACVTGPLITLGGCASAGLDPGTGDVSFRLVWKGAADLDLHVQDPSGEQLSFIQRESRSGGILDIDCNAGPEQICNHPIENVYWREGSAPEGLYRYHVEFFRGVAGDADHSTYISGHEVERGASAEAQASVMLQVPFVLEVRLGDRVVRRQVGELTTETRVAGPYDYEFARP